MAGIHEARSRRLPAIVAVVALLVAGGLADRAGRPRLQSVATGRSAAGVGMPVAAPATALSSSWFCAFAPLGGPTASSLVIVNPGTAPAAGTVTLVPTGADPGPDQPVNRDQSVAVPPRSRVAIAESDFGTAKFVAALVEMDGGGVVVEQAASSPAGNAGSPCASSASQQWHFADGTTAKDDTLLVGLFNPFADDAVVDFNFTTEQGREGTVGELQAVPVGPRSLVVIDIGQHLRRRDHVATTVTTVAGRVVAAQLQVKQAAGAPTGLSLELGTPRPGTSWTFPDGLAATGLVENFHFYNPSSLEARVEVSMTLDQGSAEPFTLTVPPLGTAVLAANKETRIPAGVGHATAIRSLNGVGVVVDRSYDAGPPGSRAGIAQTSGASEAATRWAFAYGDASPAFGEWVVVFNPSSSAAHLRFTGLIASGGLPIDGLQDVTVGPGQRAAVHLTDHLQQPDLGLLVEATAPIVAERLLDAGPGVIATMGIPLS
jgi:Family of unknown function (DUF5719)